MGDFIPNQIFLRRILLHLYTTKISFAESYFILKNVYRKYSLSAQSCMKWFKRFKTNEFNIEEEETVSVYPRPKHRIKRKWIMEKWKKIYNNLTEIKYFKVNETMSDKFIESDPNCHSGKIVKRQAEVAATAAVITIPAFAANLIMYLFGGIVIGITVVYFADYLQGLREDKNREIMMQLMRHEVNRTRINCMGNNFGCLYNICWSNCGPFLNTQDFCFTNNPDTQNNNNIFLDIKGKNLSVAACNKDSECHPCWPCATVCGSGM